MNWLLYKIGSWFTVVGLICSVFLSQLESDVPLFIASTVAGLLFAIAGIRFGYTTWEDSASPMKIFFLSNIDIMDNKVLNAIIWGVRFFFMPFILAVLYRIIQHW